MFVNYYDILEVYPSATNEEIRRAYFELAREHHPDRGGDGSVMAEITRAWAALRTPAKRAAYDKLIAVAMQVCAQCDGRGHIATRHCLACDGGGYVTRRAARARRVK